MNIKRTWNKEVQLQSKNTKVNKQTNTEQRHRTLIAHFGAVTIAGVWFDRHAQAFFFGGGGIAQLLSFSTLVTKFIGLLWNRAVLSGLCSRISISWGSSCQATPSAGTMQCLKNRKVDLATWRHISSRLEHSWVRLLASRASRWLRTGKILLRQRHRMLSS